MTVRVVSLREFSQMADSVDYVTLEEATRLSDYSARWLRVLCQEETIVAIKLNGPSHPQWLLNLPSLKAYARGMEEMGVSKHVRKDYRPEGNH